MNLAPVYQFRRDAPAWEYAASNLQALAAEVAMAVGDNSDDDGNLPIGPHVTQLADMLRGSLHERRHQAVNIVTTLALHKVGDVQQEVTLIGRD